MMRRHHYLFRNLHFLENIPIGGHLLSYHDLPTLGSLAFSTMIIFTMLMNTKFYLANGIGVSER